MPNQDKPLHVLHVLVWSSLSETGVHLSLSPAGEDPEKGNQKGWVGSWVLLSDQLYPNRSEDWQLSRCVKWNGSCHQASKAPGSQKGLGLDLSKNRSKGDSD